jgi:uncharacterized protein with HEPN domain
MSDRTDREFAADIREAIKRISLYVNGVSYESFVADIRTQDAVIRNLEILGEATKNISEAYRANRPNVPWKSMAETRDRLIHHYFGVNLDIVWEIIAQELPAVATELDRLDVDAPDSAGTSSGSTEG